MPEILCTDCGEVGPDNAGRCAKCGGADVLPADHPQARKFIEARKARHDAQAGSVPPSPSTRSAATGKVLGRALGRVFKK